jgi:hypothetical protein
MYLGKIDNDNIDQGVNAINQYHGVNVLTKKLKEWR